MQSLAIHRIAILGVGLIGGSFAAGLRRAGFQGEIVGYGRSAEQLEHAQNQGWINHFTHDAEAAVTGAELILLATPVSICAEMLPAITQAAPNTAVFTDVASVKAPFVEAVEALPSEVAARVVPGHPIAGTEQRGAKAAFAELYDGARVVLTPPSDAGTFAQTAENALNLVRDVWTYIGARVEVMDAAEHDHLYALVSHLPHLVAFALADTIAQAGDARGRDFFQLSGGGLRDFLRIAASDPNLWRDIFEQNRDELLTATEAYRNALDEMVDLLKNDQGVKLQSSIARAVERVRAARKDA